MAFFVVVAFTTYPVVVQVPVVHGDEMRFFCEREKKNSDAVIVFQFKNLVVDFDLQKKKKEKIRTKFEMR